MPNQWQMPAQPPEQLYFELLDVPRPIVQILFNRGLRSAAAMRQFLTPAESPAFGDPLALKGMAYAVERVQAAIAQGEQIAVYADFDVDGICSAVLLVQALQSLGGIAEAYIPHRVEEGYGLNCPAISRLAEAGVRLIITADCGTSAVAEVAHANSLGVDVIVTDHHHVHKELPPALAVLDPRQDGCSYPFAELAGVGVAFKLAQALLAQHDGQAAAQYLDLVALGTVIDVAPLVGENRDLVRLGLAALRAAPRPGLRALMRQARVEPARLDTGHLGFVIGPRLNAAGRLDSARVSYDLLQSTTEEQAKPLAQELEGQNQERQRLLEAALMEARPLAAAQVQQRPLIFVASEAFLAGIVGLVAGRLAEEFHRPAIAVERGSARSRGSCRSIPGFHIARALDECHELLVRHGGHEQAAGFAIETDRLADLEDRLAGIAARDLAGVSLEPVIAVDCALPLREATWDTHRWLQRMQPFGAGNRTPILRSDGVRVRTARIVGKDHLSLAVTDGRVTWPAIAFRQGQLLSSAQPGACIDVVYNLDEHVAFGEQVLQLVVKDLRPHA